MLQSQSEEWGRRILEVAQIYHLFWSEPDQEKRQELIENIWAEDALYSDPMIPPFFIKGREAINQLAIEFQTQRPGESFKLISGIDHHNRNARWESRWLAVDGSIVLDGLDVVEFNENGKLKRVVSFWGSVSKSQEVTSYNIQLLLGNK